MASGCSNGLPHCEQKAFPCSLANPHSVQYTIAEKFVPSLAYVRSDVKDSSQNIDDTANEYLSLGASYKFTPNFQTYVDYKVNLLDDNAFTKQYGINTDDVVAVAMRYDF